jgi:hypothetical protein
VERRGGALPAPEGLRKRAETLLGEVPVKGEHVVQLQLSHERKTRTVDEAELAKVCGQHSTHGCTPDLLRSQVFATAMMPVLSTEILSGLVVRIGLCQVLVVVLGDI